MARQQFKKRKTNGKDKIEFEKWSARANISKYGDRCRIFGLSASEWVVISMTNVTYIKCSMFDVRLCATIQTHKLNVVRNANASALQTNVANGNTAVNEQKSSSVCSNIFFLKKMKLNQIQFMPFNFLFLRFFRLILVKKILCWYENQHLECFCDWIKALRKAKKYWKNVLISYKIPEELIKNLQ